MSNLSDTFLVVSLAPARLAAPIGSFAFPWELASRLQREFHNFEGVS